MARIAWTEISSNQREASNVIAGLETLARSEGTWHRGDDGYNILVGGKFFTGYAKHPAIAVTLPGSGITSTAAGRYQFLLRTWMGLVGQHHYEDFEPDNQDRGCIELMRQAGGLDDLKKGLIGNWIDRCAKTWASLPGAGYGQHEWTRDQIVSWFQQSGGKLYAFEGVQS